MLLPWVLRIPWSTQWPAMVCLCTLGLWPTHGMELHLIHCIPVNTGHTPNNNESKLHWAFVICQAAHQISLLILKIIVGPNYTVKLRDFDYVAWSCTGNDGELKFEPKCPDPKDEQNPKACWIGPVSFWEKLWSLTYVYAPGHSSWATGHRSTEALWACKSQW